MNNVKLQSISNDPLTFFLRETKNTLPNNRQHESIKLYIKTITKVLNSENKTLQEYFMKHYEVKTDIRTKQKSLLMK